jgi:hypothetical protein
MDAQLVELEDGSWLVRASDDARGLPLPSLTVALSVANAFMSGAGIETLCITWADGRYVALDGSIPEDDDLGGIQALFGDD